MDLDFLTSGSYRNLLNFGKSWPNGHIFLKVKQHFLVRYKYIYLHLTSSPKVEVSRKTFFAPTLFLQPLTPKTVRSGVRTKNAFAHALVYAKKYTKISKINDPLL